MCKFVSSLLKLWVIPFFKFFGRQGGGGGVGVKMFFVTERLGTLFVRLKSAHQTLLICLQNKQLFTFLFVKFY